MAILKKFIGADQVDGSKILVLNDEAIRAKNSSGSAVALFKLTTANVLEFAKLPRAASGLTVGDDADLTTKKYVDDAVAVAVSGASSEATALEERVSGIEADYGVAGGLATLDENGKVPASQLTIAAFEYKGTWDASANSPALSDVSGNTGDVYHVVEGGSRDLGSGAISFTVGDKVVYNGSVWEKWDLTDQVTSVNGMEGAVTLVADDIGTSVSGVTIQDDLDAMLKLDGSRAMTGDLDMAGHGLTGVSGVSLEGEGAASIVADDLSFSVSGVLSFEGSVLTSVGDGVAATDAATKGQLDAAVSGIQAEEETFLKLDGTRAMTGDLDMAAHNVLIGEGGSVSGAFFQLAGAKLGLSGSAESELLVGDAAYEHVSIKANSIEMADSEAFIQVGGYIEAPAVSGQYYTLQSGVGLAFTDGNSVVSLAAGAAILDGDELTFDGASAAKIQFLNGGAVSGLTALVGDEDASFAAPKGFVEAQDLLLLPLDGSRAMTGNLDMDGHGLTGVSGMTISGESAGTITADDLSFAVSGVLSFGGSVLTSVGDGVLATDAATKGQLDTAVSGLQSDIDTAVSGIQSDLDGLAVEQLVHESFTLDAAAVSGGYIDSANVIVGQPMIMVGRVVLLPTEDFTVGNDGASARKRITWAGAVAAAGAEALEAGDIVHVYYHKSVNPFMA